MLSPFLLVAAAVAVATVMAYGTHPDWAGFAFGLRLIVLTRLLLWPLVVLSLLLAGGLVVMVATGRRRAWWLVGLLPVLALFLHRFATDPINRLGVVENPPFVGAEQSGLADTDRVVGVVFRDVAYAFPYGALHRWPVVAVSDFDERVLLLWSPFANAAWAGQINRELRVRDLEIVSMPANGLLLYNARFGQFIAGITGKTHDGEKPVGVESPLPLAQTTWGAWRQLHPETKVLGLASDLPSVPLPPRYDFPPAVGELPNDAPVVVVLGEPPTAIPADQLGDEPVHLSGAVPAVVFRHAGAARALDRRIEDMVPRFVHAPDGSLRDTDTGTTWTADGKRISGPRETRGVKLQPLPVQDGIYFGAARFWYPNLRLLDPASRTPEQTSLSLTERRTPPSS